MPTSSTKPRLVLAVPHELLLEALAGLLGGSGFTVVARCTGVAEIERCVRAHAPDLAVVDSDLVPAGELADALRGTRDALSGGHLVVLAPGLDATLARETLALEVDGVLLKSTTRGDFAANLCRLAAGDAVYPAGWLAAARRLPGEGEGEAALSDRQREVLELLAQGLPNEVIAERLFISKNTVKFHVAAIYERLGVRNRVQAAQALATMHPRASG